MIAIDGNDHTLTVEGTGLGIRVELTELMREMLGRGIIDESDLDTCVKYAKMSTEELDAERDRKWEELRQMLDERGTDEDRAMFALATMLMHA